MSTAGRLSAIVIACLPLLALLDRAAAQSTPANDFEDAPTRLVPKRPRDEAAEDRLSAEAHYAHGRLLLQRDDEAGALRRFQRAWRYDPLSVPLWREVVPLAARLNRAEELGRYAVLAAEQDNQDPATLMRLGALLTEQRDWPRAVRLYQRVRELRKDAPRDFTTALVDLELGRLHFLTGSSQAAADAFIRVREALAQPEAFGLDQQLLKLLLDKPAQTYQMFGEAFLDAERWDDAAEAFRQANDAEPKAGLLAYQIARVELGRGQPAQAIEQLEKYFAVNRSEAGTAPYELLAKALRKRETDPSAADAQARKRLDELHQRFPGNIPLAFALAEQYRQAEQWEPAERIYRKLLKQQPAADVYGALASTYVHRKQAEALVVLLGEALARGGTLDAIGDVADELGERKELAAEVIRLARRPADSKTAGAGDGQAFAAALVAIQAKDFEAADELFSRAIAAGIPPSAQTHLTWGLQMLLADQPARAAEVFRKAIDSKVRPESDQTFYYYLAGALEMAGRTDEALAAGERALAVGPKTPRMVSRVAWIPYHAKRMPDAEKAYRELLRTYDKDFTTEGVRESVREARLILSNICVQTNRVPEAEQWLEQVLDEYPEDVGALNDLGYLWADQGKHLQRALAMCRHAVRDEPDNRAYRDSLGWAFYRVGQYAEAVVELEKAVDTKDPDGVIWDHLGDARWKANQPDAARDAWRRAVAAYQQDHENEKAVAVEAKLKQP